jgi:hypothetical protein
MLTDYRKAECNKCEMKKYSQEAKYDRFEILYDIA